MQDRMQYSAKSTSHEYLIFVIWKIILKLDMTSVKKNRVVVDIWALNKITKIDIYSMSSQTNIISSITKCFYISTVNVLAFFYQWLVRKEDRHKLTVVTHRNQEQFNVEVMSFKNISFYVQREIDNILRKYKDFCRVYIDDIIIFSVTRSLIDSLIEYYSRSFNTIWN